MDRPLALVAGASYGIGNATAQHLARHGFDLIVNARSRDRLQELSARVREGAAVTVVAGDLREDAVLASLETTLAGRPLAAVVICTAALVDPDAEASVSQYDRSRLREVFDTTARLPLEVFQIARPSLALAHGKAIFIASDWALQGSHGPSVFSAAKAAVLHFARTERRSSARDGVHLSVIVAGDVATFNEDWSEPTWTLDDSSEAVWAAFQGARISLHEVIAAIDLILQARTGRVDEVYLTPVDPHYDF